LETNDLRSATDIAIVKRANRRQLRERVSLVFAGAVVTAMVAAFYTILTS
jgi:hypothetical protein